MNGSVLFGWKHDGNNHTQDDTDEKLYPDFHDFILLLDSILL
jgi:hypothetical protein